MRYLSLLLISFNALADWSLGAGGAIVKQELRFDNYIQFNMPTAYLEVQYWSDYLVGGRALVIHSKKTDESGYSDFSSKIDFGWQFELGFKIDINDTSSLFATSGITEYKASWWQRGKEAAWSGGTDSSKNSWSVGYQYQINKKLKLQLMYSRMYEKDKPMYGKEITQSYSAGLSYIF